jgi:hypothetical protein
MARVKPEDIAFWIIISMIIAIIIWKVFGSPTDTATLITLTAFIAALIIALWKGIYSIESKVNIKLHNLDKKTSLSFMKLKNNMNNHFTNINKRLDNIENLIKNK